MNVELTPRSWRVYQRLLSQRAVELLTASEERSNSVPIMLSIARHHERLIIPRGNQPFRFGFRTTEGIYHPEQEIAQHPNGLTTHYLDENVAARPAYPVFTIGNDIRSYQPSLHAQYEMDGNTLSDYGFDWLSRRSLFVFLFSADYGTLVGEFIAPIELAHALVSWGILHKTFTYEELDAGLCRKADTTFVCAPGLRRSIFGDHQNVTFYPVVRGQIDILGSTVYRGCFAKKPLFVALSWRFAEVGDMAAHASLAVPKVEDPRGKKCTFMIQAESSRGKTELRMPIPRYVKDGQLILGWRQSAHGLVTMPFSPDCHPEYVSHGDDGVRLFLNPKNGTATADEDDAQFVEARNWEQGAFDRNSGAYRKGDLPEIDAIMNRHDPQWWEVQTDNLAANPGDRINHWERDQIHGKPARNPRVTYSNKLLAAAGVATSQASLRVRHSLLAFARIEGVTCNGPWAKLPRGLAALYEILGGPDVNRSKSITEVVPASKVLAPKVKFSHVGTMAQFSALPLDLQIDQVLAFRASYPGMDCHLITQEQLPPDFDIDGSTALKEIEYLPELLMRDLIYAITIGKAEVDWAPSPYPFLGYVPVRIKLGNHEMPLEFFSPEKIYDGRLQHNAQEWYSHVIAELKLLQEKGVSPQAAKLFDAVRALYPDNVVKPMTLEESSRRMDELTAIVDECKGMAPQL